MTNDLCPLGTRSHDELEILAQFVRERFMWVLVLVAVVWLSGIPLASAQLGLPKDDGAQLRAAGVRGAAAPLGGGWAMELELGAGVDSQASPDTLGNAIEAIARNTSGRQVFPKRLGVRSVEIAIDEEASRQSLLSAYRSVLNIKGVESVRIRNKSAELSASQEPDRRTAVGLIVKPRASDSDDLGSGKELRPKVDIAAIRAVTGYEFARAVPLAGGMFALPFALPMAASEASVHARVTATLSNIEWAEMDVLNNHHRLPNDSFFDRQWNLAAGWGINGPQAWDISIGSPGVVVAVLDTGVLSSQPDLAPKLTGGYDFIASPYASRDGDGPDGDPSDNGNWAEVGDCGNSTFMPSSWHGSHVAGIIGAASNNDYGITGVAWDVRIMPIRVLGRCGGAISDIINGMYWAAGLSVPGVPRNPTPARILNMSLGSKLPAWSCSKAYADAVNAVRGAGAIVVAAAGNNGQDLVGEAAFYEPGGCPGVITVGASDHQGFRALYSNFSDQLVVDLSAPGGDIKYHGTETAGIYSTVDSGIRGPVGPSGRYTNGTSQAAPHVSGILALMLSANPSLSNAQLYNTLIETSREFNQESVCYRDSVCGWGIANAHSALVRATTDPANTYTSVSISSSLNPSPYGTTFTVTATVSPSNVTGKVTFLNDGVPLSGCTLISLSGGQVGCNFNNWAVNTSGYRISVRFEGDYTHHWAYSNTINQIVYSNSSSPTANSTAVEYYHAAFGHYFVTAAIDEIATIDGGTFAGWARTGSTFKVFPLNTSGASNVCRFFSTAFAPKSSHFYTPFASECASVRSNRDWQYEGTVFGMKLPDANGTCASGTVPLYRLYNNGRTGAPNHRYTTSLSIRSQMMALGFIPEGAGTLGVIGCVPQ